MRLLMWTNWNSHNYETIGVMILWCGHSMVLAQEQSRELRNGKGPVLIWTLHIWSNDIEEQWRKNGLFCELLGAKCLTVGKK